MKVLHTKVDVEPFGPDSAYASIDHALRAAGSTEVVLDWTAYQYEPDGVHFTRESALRFCSDVADAVKGEEVVHLVTDSTLGFHPGVDEHMASLLKEGSSVSCVNGSGFVATSRLGTHFAARASDNERATCVLFIGGWNDHQSPHLQLACRGAVRQAGKQRRKPHARGE